MNLGINGLMPTEIEAKLKVESLQEVENKLSELDAEFLQEQSQIDYYFDDSEETFKRSDTALRLRRQRSGDQEKILLTYKGAKEKDNFKKRQEVEVEISDLDSAEKLLSAIGYRRALTVEKRRRIWRLSGCTVALDELPLLGSFVEIEGPDDKTITDLQRGLGLANLSHIPKSYASLIAERLHK